MAFLVEAFKLICLPNHTILKPDGEELCLVIDRNTFNIEERALTAPEIVECTREGVQAIGAFGCVGFIKLLAG